MPLLAVLNASVAFVLAGWLIRECNSYVRNGVFPAYNSEYKATKFAVVPKTMIFESPLVTRISSLMRENSTVNVSSALGITTEYWGTFSKVGGSDVSIVEIET